MNPITRAHLAMIEYAKSLGETFVYLSHTHDHKKNPLTYDRKIYWAQKAAGDCVKESDANVIIEALKEVQEKGYNNLIYMCGSDRKEDMETLLNKYNGKQDQKGEIQYKFDSIEVKQFGDERLTEDVPLEKCSASLARQCAEEDDFKLFSEIVPFDEDDAYELFIEVKEGLGIFTESTAIDDLNNLYQYELNEAEKDGDKLYNRKLSRSVNSISSAYDLIQSEINKLDITDDTKEEISNIIDKVELLTNSIDINKLDTKKILNFMNKTNLSSVTDLMQFISQFSSPDELNNLVSKRRIQFNTGANIRQDALKLLSEETVNNLSKFRPIKNSVSTGVGEVLIATIYSGGALPAKGEHGDVVINGQPIEVKTDNGVIGPFRQNKTLYDYIRPMLKATGATGARGNVGNGTRHNFKNEKLSIDQIKEINEIGRKINVKFGSNATQLEVFDTLFSLALKEYLTGEEKILLTNGDSKNPKLDKSIIINREDSARKLESEGVFITFADDRNSGDKFKITLR